MTPHGAIEELPIREGALVSEPHDALGRIAHAKLDEAARSPSAHAAFRPGPIAAAGREISLVRWVKQHLVRALDAERAAALARRVGDTPIVIGPAFRLDPSVLDAHERLLLAALDRPRGVDELATRTRQSRYRVLSFVHFLDVVGALAVTRSSRASADAPVAGPPREAPSARAASANVWSSRTAALRLLGLPPEADGALVRHAYRKLARALHPDLHPGVGEGRRRELERRLAHVNAAYGLLTAG